MRTLLSLLALALALTIFTPHKDAVGAPTGAQAEMQRTLESNHWTLTSATGTQGKRIEGLLVDVRRPIVFKFVNGNLHINGGCNRIWGGYQIDGESRLKIKRMAATKIGCIGAHGEIDGVLLALLRPQAKIGLEPGTEPRLRLITSGKTTLSFKGQMSNEAR